MDRETVITHLQIIHTWASYAHEYNLHFITSKHLEDMAQWADDALALLKEQEAVEPVITPWAENEDGEVVIAKKECGRCGYQFFTEKPNYCENCGAPILWEGR